MSTVLQNLLNETKAIQPSIDQLKALSGEDTKLFTGEKDQKAAVLYHRIFDVRDRHNKKLIELATFGLTMDWNNPTEVEVTTWGRLSDELATLEKDMQVVQAESQAFN